MEYTNNKRTMNLTLRDIHIGDWVQCWNKITERYTPPEKITAIFEDGTVNTIIDDEQGDPFEYDISEVDALPITPELLQGFGFDVVPKDYPENESNILYNGKKICELWVLTDCIIMETPWDSYEYFNLFVDGMYDIFPELLSLEWKGVKS